MMNGEIILPSDPHWIIPNTEEFNFVAAAAVGKNSFVISAQLEGDLHDLADYYSRFYRYDEERWLCTEVAATISSITTCRHGNWQNDGLAVLTLHGDVWFIGETTEGERLPGAEIIQSEDGTPFGFVSRIKSYGDELFVNGMDGEFFRRRDGVWRSDDVGLRRFVSLDSEQDQPAWIRDVVALPNGDFYACGHNFVGPSLFWRPKHGQWTELKIESDDASLKTAWLECMLYEPDEKILIATNSGVLLSGNGRSGFRAATDIVREGISNRPFSFTSMTRFKDDLYCGGHSGLYRLRHGGRLETVTGPPGESVYKSEAGSTSIPAISLQVSEDTLWAFGPRSIAKFDGTRWHRIVMPSIYNNPK